MVKLTLPRILDASMAVFAEAGHHGLSMRRVAERLDVHAGSLYYHVRDKTALLRLMADRVAQEAYDAGTAALDALPPDADWTERVEAQVGALRHTLLRHIGGAALLAGSAQTLSSGALGLMERLLVTFADAGVPEAERGIAADAVLSHVTGFVMQEQAEDDVPEVDASQVASLAARFPLTFAEATATAPEEKFVRGLRLVCAGVRPGRARA